MSRKPRTLTDDDIKALTVPRGKDRDMRADPDCRGMYFRLMKSGVKSYVVAERGPGGKQVWSTIARCEDMPVEDARIEARARIKRIKAGLPAVKPPALPPESLQATVDSWLLRHVKENGLISERAIRRRLKIMVAFLGAGREFAGIKRSDIAALLDHVVDNHSRRVADQVFSDFQGLDAFYAARNDDYVSPLVRGLRMRRDFSPPRERVLDDDELRAVWAAAGDAGAFGAVVRMCLLSAQRRTVILEMRWEHIDDAGVWHIPRSSDREKSNGGDLKLPALALDIVRAQPRFASNPFVFAASRGAANLNAGAGHHKAAFDRRLPGMAPWTLHDLRRTARTLMAKAAVPRDAAERTLGHRVGSVIERTYDVHKYDREKGVALEALAAMIKSILAGPAPAPANVIPLQRA
jgi:integrase